MNLAITKSTNFPFAFFGDVNIIEVDTQMDCFYIVMQKLQSVQQGE